MKPKYPIYIISKGRPKCVTAKHLKQLNVPFYIVVEPHQLNDYKKENPTCNFLTTPFKNLNKASIPVRNWVWDHSINNKFEKHWVLDDNINGFYRLNKNTKYRVLSSSFFRAMEDFTDRFSNVGLSGPNYFGFCKKTDKYPPFYYNTRIYSCILVNNNLPFRWRGIFNEDTDLSLRTLKNNMCTILFNAFLCDKATTLRMTGGNTDEIYKNTNKRFEFALSLQNQHPDVVKITKKFNRFHHQVNYKPFKNIKLVKKSNISYPSNIIDEYNMKLKHSSQINLW
tara:strand:+ start:2853 stop:3698 length:846 start_codon:yes stop_codon:yes gene_type:complete